MSDDIVQRLRSRSAKDEIDLWSDESDDELHDAAADEIERLRLIISYLQADVRMTEIANETLSTRPQMELSRLRSLITEWADAEDTYGHVTGDVNVMLFRRDLREAVGR